MSERPSVPLEVDRRGLLASFFWAATSFVGVALLAPLVGYFLGPLRRRAALNALPIARLSDLPPDVPRRVEVALRRRDAWVTEEGRLAAWVVRRKEGVLVFDPRCTHLGCAYHWHAQTNQFLCPCHNGLYDIEGRVVGGPPPRPLDVYPARVEDGVVYVVPTSQRRA